MNELTAFEQRSFVRSQTLRIFFVAAFVAAIDFIFNLGVPLWLQIGSSSLAVIIAGKYAKRGASLPRVLVVHAVLFAAIYYLLLGINWLVLSTDKENRDFVVSFLIDQVSILGLIYGLVLLSTWAYWTKRGATFIEAIAANLAVIGTLAGHRNYQIDAPKEISSLTWKYEILQRYHLEPQQLLIAIGGGCAFLALFYFYFSAARPIFAGKRVIGAKYRGSFLESVLTALAFAVVIFFYGQRLNDSYRQDISRASEGVGQAAKEGESSLGFHSATGNSNQPMALVRLESDYVANPWSPMIYFREGSLSLYNGREMVTSDTSYDIDVPRSSPTEPFIGVRTDPGAYRDRLTYSVFLLAQHKTPPAIDMPIRIGSAQNPDPKSFISVYQVASLVPTIKVEDLAAEQVGDPTWNQEVLEHYLRAPGSRSESEEFEITDMSKPVLDKYGEDLRYLYLTRKITGGAVNPIQRAAAIIKYLSENSTYTHTPGHTVTPDGDPVAPYLFSSDMRGYCVHFSHAATYLLRLAGIPARVGTGYLTDLTYAKDGHILLQMGDRHAWPEMYINGLGWATFDVQPAKAENEQAPIPDSEILEKLMGKLDSLPKLEDIPPAPNTTNNDKYSPLEFLAKLPVKQIAIALVILFLLLKLWLRFGYLLARNETAKVKGLYISMASTFLDTGTGRDFGETRSEYLQRLKHGGAGELSALGGALGDSVYGNARASNPLDIQLSVKNAVRTIHPLRRCLSFVNPASILRWRRW